MIFLNKLKRVALPFIKESFCGCEKYYVSIKPSSSVHYFTLAYSTFVLFQMHIYNPVKHLWWNFFEKQLIPKIQYLFLKKNFIINVWHGSKYASAFTTWLSMSMCNYWWKLVKVFKNRPSKICGRQLSKNLEWYVYIGRPYYFKIIKGCVLQVLLVPFLYTLTQV